MSEFNPYEGQLIWQERVNNTEQNKGVYLYDPGKILILKQ